MTDVVCIASWNADLVSRIARPLLRGETLMGHHFTIESGGKGSNAAIACARQGAAVSLVARIGDDDFGRMAIAIWKQEGIDARHVDVAQDERSGVAQILIYDDGDNSIAVTSGAGAGLAISHVQAAAQQIQGARVVMASCEVPTAATTQAFRIAREADVITLLNPAPAMPLSQELLSFTDILTPNEGELRILAGVDPLASVADAAALLLRQGIRTLVVTLGSAGCILFRQGQPPLALSGHVVNVTDTVGAGDCFTGTLAAQLARGLDIEQALGHANAAAALSVMGHGALGGLPSHDAVVRWLASR